MNSPSLSQNASKWKLLDRRLNYQKARKSCNVLIYSCLCFFVRIDRLKIETKNGEVRQCVSSGYPRMSTSMEALGQDAKLESASSVFRLALVWVVDDRLCLPQQ